MNRSVSLDVLSTHRTQLMGLAAIMILCCHAESDGVSMPRCISWLLSWGNYGVDLFFAIIGMWIVLFVKKGPFNRRLV